MLIFGVGLETMDGVCLPRANIDTLALVFHQLVLAINETAPFEFGGNDAVCQEDGFFRTGFFAQATENAAQHIDLIDLGVFLFAVQFFFAFLSFGSGHGNGLSRTRNGAKSAGRAAFRSVLVAFQNMLSTVDGGHVTFHFGVTDRSFLFEKVFYRYA